MSARIYGGVPLTLMMAVVLLQGGAAAGWWPMVLPQATVLATGVAWVCGLWLFWQLDATRRPQAVPQPPVGKRVGPPVAVRAERRRAPRFDIRCPVELDLPEHGRQQGELQDISQGGARIAGIPLMERDSYGVLRIPGITLPVPFLVVAGTPQGEVRVRFELAGLALETFLRQFERLVGADEMARALRAS